jgi:hypothetical protein
MSKKINITSKAKKFNKILLAAKNALDSIGIKFHLHFGTALGSHREKSFIEHDDDIDIGVFYKDVNKSSQINQIEKAMIENGFRLEAKLGKLEESYEMQFEMDGIGFDIFWIHEGEYRGKKYYIFSSYYGMCDDLPKKKCVWGVRPYKTEKINFLGEIYNVIPQKTLVDSYGDDWMTPKKFGYHEGLETGAYRGLLTDYYDPRPTNNKIAFCFLLYDRHKHSDIWVKFFNEDKFPEKNFNIYTHLKEVNENTQKWVSDNSIRSIKTGWCEENLVFAWIKLLETALKNPDNKYFTILSGECIPLFNFVDTYKKITSSSKSRINIDFNAEATFNTGLLYADQWVVLNRKHAKILVNLKKTIEGKKYMKEMKSLLCQEDSCYCPDELYPINWFVKKYGNPSSSTFKKEFRCIPSTYTYWDGVKPSPIKFNTPKMLKKRKTICNSGSLFARKFNSKSGRILGMSCEKYKTKSVKKSKKRNQK